MIKTEICGWLQKVLVVLAVGLACGSGGAQVVRDESTSDDVRITPQPARSEEQRRIVRRQEETERKAVGLRGRAFEIALQEATTGPVAVRRQRLRDLHMAVEKETRDLEARLAQQQAAVEDTQEKTEKAKSILEEDTRDDSSLPREERVRRHQLRLEKLMAEYQVQKVRAEFERLKEERREAENQLHLVEAELAKLQVRLPRRTSEDSEASPPSAPLTAAGSEHSPLAPRLTEQPSSPPAPAEIPTRPRTGVVGFFRDRALDLCDLLRFRFHIPRGYRSVGLKARATWLAQAGLIYCDGKSIGVDRRGAGIWREQRLEGGVGPIYLSRVFEEMKAGNRYTDLRRPWSRIHRRGIVRHGVFWDDGRLHPLSCGAEVQLFVFGFEIEVYPLEWLDIPLGWLGFDSANDDESRILRQWREWQTTPELKVRDEWDEKYEPKEKLLPPREQKIMPSREKKPSADEEPLGDKQEKD